MICAFSQATRPAAHAGRFYEADARALRGTVAGLLAESPRTAFSGTPVALIAPHAGYAYSGRVAAAAFRTIQGAGFDRVLILAPTHTTDFKGAALPEEAAFATPLGEIPVDRRAAEFLAGRDGFAIVPKAHDEEHAVEVELPFLQVALPAGFQILPMTIGRTTAGDLHKMADALEEMLSAGRERGEKWLVLASSDTYHGHDRAAGRANDEALALIISGMDADELASRAARKNIMACGWKAIAMTMMLAKRLGARECRILERRDSSEARGEGRAATEGSYVVGYLGAAFQAF